MHQTFRHFVIVIQLHFTILRHEVVVYTYMLTYYVITNRSILVIKYFNEIDKLFISHILATN